MIPLIVATMAPIVNCVQLFPQLYKTFTTKRVTDLSFHTLVLVLVTNLLWLLHGYFILDVPILMASFINLLANCTLMGFYLLYKRK